MINTLTLVCFGITVAVVDLYIFFYYYRTNFKYITFLCTCTAVNIAYAIMTGDVSNTASVFRAVITIGGICLGPSLLLSILYGYIGNERRTNYICTSFLIVAQTIFVAAIIFTNNLLVNNMVTDVNALKLFSTYLIYKIAIVFACVVTVASIAKTVVFAKTHNGIFLFLPVMYIILQFIIISTAFFDNLAYTPFVYTLCASISYATIHFFGIYGEDYHGLSLVNERTTGNAIFSRNRKLMRADQVAQELLPELSSNIPELKKSKEKIYSEFNEWFDRIDEGEKKVLGLIEHNGNYCRVVVQNITVENGSSVYRLDFRDETELQKQKNYYIRERKTSARYKRRLQNTFEDYMDPKVMQIMMEDEFAFAAGKEQDITVLFADIHSFTQLCEDKSPTEIVEILNKCLSAMTSCVMQNRGVIDKFIGDCVMALWNTPIEQEDANYLACKTATDMKAEFKKLNVELQKNYGVTVTLGTGIASGNAVVGNIGAETRHQFTAIGDIVNIASRLQGLSDIDEILITESVAKDVIDIADMTKLKSMPVKGRHQMVEVYRLNSVGGR